MIKAPITLAPEAKEHFKKIAAGKTVCFGIKSGGCSGFKYFWQIVESDQLEDDYESYGYGDFSLAIDKISMMYLMGCIITYVNDITGNHIEIENPLSSAACGCGESITFDF